MRLRDNTIVVVVHNVLLLALHAGVHLQQDLFSDVLF